VQQGRDRRSIDLVCRALALDATQARFHTLLGMALSSAGRYAEALAQLRSSDCARRRDAHGSRADALVALGRLADAVESFDRALVHDPSSVPDWCNRGAALIDLGRAAEAADSFARATALAPDFAEAHYNHGNALAKLERHADAVASYDRALALKPDYVDALNNRANALNQLEALPERTRGRRGGRWRSRRSHSRALVTRMRAAAQAPPLRRRALRAASMPSPSCPERHGGARPVRADLLTDLEAFR
jgi:tetratricopeptide (TPR) repeat protein